ncbi:proline dehydrogenase family protein [Crocinitomicaceae bacterium]|nr:proline dehydrogenase family protein [Crocinitomicaceae bacterium]
MLNFNDTNIAFKIKSNYDLKRAYWLFRIIGSPLIVKLGKFFMIIALKLRLPVNFIVKRTIFKQFCGGETIQECTSTIETLGKYKVGTILDYSVEGKFEEDDFDQTTRIIIETIEKAAQEKNIPFAVFKITGISKFSLLEKASTDVNQLSNVEAIELEKVKNRIDNICSAAKKQNVPVFIDAEETWVQDIIDQWAFDMMILYNKEKCIVYNTIQMYRHDRLAFLEDCLQKAKKHNISYGIKLVRGAYMEKERNRAKEMGYLSPIQIDKESTDRDYDLALDYILKNINYLSLVAGTHNENSSKKLALSLEKHNITKDDSRIFFAQLLGMSDHISFNLADHSYNVAKYVPFGPIKEVMPYLLRRADENTSVAGQTGRELGLIKSELQSRKSNSKL